MSSTALSGIDYSDYNAALEEAKAALEAKYGAEWVDKIDGELTTLDLTNETLLAYFRLAYEMLLQEIYQEGTTIAGAGQVGDESIDWLTVVPDADPALHEFIVSLLRDDPDLIAYYASQAEGESAEEFVLNLLYNETDGGSSDFTGYTDDAKELASIFNMGSGYDALIEQEDLFDYYIDGVMQGIAEIDEEIMELYNQLLTGDISDIEFDAMSEDLSATKEFYFAAVQQLMSDKASFFQAISEILQKMYESQVGIAERFRV